MRVDPEQSCAHRGVLLGCRSVRPGANHSACDSRGHCTSVAPSRRGMTLMEARSRGSRSGSSSPRAPRASPASCGAATATRTTRPGSTTAEAIADRLRAGTLRSTVGRRRRRRAGRPRRSRPPTPRRRRRRVGPGGRRSRVPRPAPLHAAEARAADGRPRDGLFGLYSEATAAHPYSQRANVALGAVETGLLLGYIPASVEYTAIDAARAPPVGGALLPEDEQRPRPARVPAGT